MVKRLFLCAAILAAAAGGANAESAFKWGAGLQGSAPYIGGLSASYRGFDPIYLRLVGHYWQEGHDSNFLTALQTPIVVGRSAGYKIYLNPGVGLRGDLDDSLYEQPYYKYSADSPPVFEKHIVHDEKYEEYETIGHLLLGVEFYVDTWFGVAPQERFGLNIEFGQGVSRERYTRTERKISYETEAKKNILSDTTEVYKNSQTQASVIAGIGFTVYF